MEEMNGGSQKLNYQRDPHMKNNICSLLFHPHMKKNICTQPLTHTKLTHKLFILVSYFNGIIQQRGVKAITIHIFDCKHIPRKQNLFEELKQKQLSLQLTFKILCCFQFFSFIFSYLKRRLGDEGHVLVDQYFESLRMAGFVRNKDEKAENKMEIQANAQSAECQDTEMKTVVSSSIVNSSEKIHSLGDSVRVSLSISTRGQ